MIAAPWEFLICRASPVRARRAPDPLRPGSANQAYNAPPPATPAKSSGMGGEEIIGWLIAGPGGALAAFNLWKALAGG
jgi:hypothetical protein